MQRRVAFSGGLNLNPQLEHEVNRARIAALNGSIERSSIPRPLAVHVDVRPGIDQPFSDFIRLTAGHSRQERCHSPF